MGGMIGHIPGRPRRDLFVGKNFNIHGKPYLFQRRLGAGGFGNNLSAVYAARAPSGDHVAIKVIDINGMRGAGENLVVSYLTEVKNLQELRQNSRHVVKIYDFDFDSRSGRAYIVMELGGDNLAKLILRLHAAAGSSRDPGTYIDPVIRKEIWHQMVSIVTTLTSENIVHMDLKPDNVILFGDVLKIADLGISKKANMLGYPGVGTPLFSAPEVMQDNSGHRRVYGPKADIWSLGAILYVMTYGQPPRYSRKAADPPPGQSPSRDRTLVDMLRRTLVLDPHRRADIETVLRHPYTRH
ncbi:unnamed protein product [Adineta steineri]|uniref:Protein kinase domain-containing protein n=1 Tax=Adineta steineri TaxID=433720 RepID=A0A818V216_9BILA|nr:unnamed protein product [Adineta steineri]CAF1119556.1 unnamed protein product [Adineta steineri]CAF3506154.1 unnamed protein product [Adineta steineri]CAF3706457.1 unnamed protein product [Adineta steineri]